MSGNSKSEHEFVKRLAKIVEANLHNEQFGVSELAREMKMSRSHIHRHLKTLTNLSVSQFIRNIRLEKAMEMLSKTDDSASEIAYKVGFSSPTYFNHCFHEHFGFPPGEVKKRIISNNESSAEDEISSNQIHSGLKQSKPTASKFNRKKNHSPFFNCITCFCFCMVFISNSNKRKWPA